MPSCYILLLVLCVAINGVVWSRTTSLLDDWAHLDSQPHRADSIKRRIFDELLVSADSSSISSSSEAHKYILSIQRHAIFGAQNENLPEHNKDRNVKVESISASSSYASLFETYESKNRLFVTQAYSEATNHAIDFGKYQNDIWISPLTNSSSITHYVPLFMHNDYGRRIPRTLFQHDLKIILGDYADCFGTICRIQVPALLTEKDKGQRVFRCPFGAHTVLFDAQAISPEDAIPSSVSRTIDVSLYEQRTLAKLKHRFSVKEEISKEEDEEKRYPHNTFSSSSSSSSWRVAQEHFLPDAPKSIPVVASVRLEGKEMLFIPRNYLITLSSADEHADASSSLVTTVCMMCLLDATNINVFRAHLQALAPVSSAHDRLYTFLSPGRSGSASTTATSSQITAGGMPLTMHRVPQHTTALTMDVFINKHDFLGSMASSTASSGTVNANGGSDVNADLSPTETKTLNRKDRRKQRNKGSASTGDASGGTTGAGGSSSSDFKSWQNQVQWKILIDSLLLPPVSPLSYAEIGRGHITVTFNHSFVIAEDDQAQVGFYMVLCRWKDNQEGVLLEDNLRLLKQSESEESVHTPPIVLKPSASLVTPEGLLAQAPSKDPHVTCEERQVLLNEKQQLAQTSSSVHLQKKSLLIPSLRAEVFASDGTKTSATMEEITHCQWRIHALQPSSHYQFKIAMSYGNKRGPFTSWSPRILTSAISIPETPEAPSCQEVIQAFNVENVFFPTLENGLGNTNASTTTKEALMPATFSSWNNVLPAKISLKVVPFTTNAGGVNVDSLPEQLTAEVLVRAEEDDGGKPVLGYFVHQFAASYNQLQGFLQEHDVLDRLYHRYGQELDTFHQQEDAKWNSQDEEKEHSLQLFLAELVLRDLAEGKLQLPGISWQDMGSFPYETVVKRGELITRNVYQPVDTRLRRILIRNLQPDTFYAFKVQAYNAYGVSHVSLRSMFVSWEIHRLVLPKLPEINNDGNNNNVNNKGKPPPTDELLINENSNIVRRMVYMHVSPRSEEEDSNKEDAELKKRFGTSKYTIYGRGHPNMYGALTWSLLSSYHEPPASSIRDHFLQRYAKRVSAAEQAYVQELRVLIRQLLAQQINKTKPLKSNNPEETIAPIDLGRFMSRFTVPVLVTEVQLASQRLVLSQGTMSPYLYVLPHEVVKRVVEETFQENKENELNIDQWTDEIVFHLQTTYLKEANNNYVHGHNVHLHTNQVAQRMGGVVQWQHVPLQNVSVWANHFSLYPLHANHELYFPDVATATNENKRLVAKKDAPTVWRKKMTRAISIQAEPCFIIPRPAPTNPDNGRDKHVFVATGRSNTDESDTPFLDHDTGDNEYVVDGSLYHHAKGVSEEVRDCSGRTAFIERGPRPLYQLALTAQAKGALAVVVYDTEDRRCRSFDQRCVPGANQYKDEGFAAQDVPIVWRDVSIPVYLMKRDSFEELATHVTQMFAGLGSGTSVSKKPRHEEL